MNEYKTCWQKYAVFQGRARRREYWMFTLFNILIGVAFTVCGTICTVSGFSAGKVIFNALSAIYSLAVFLPGIAVIVRRLHDVGKSGGWWFICLVPLIGGIWLFVLLVTDSQPGKNMYGDNPKEMSSSGGSSGTISGGSGNSGNNGYSGNSGYNGYGGNGGYNSNNGNNIDNDPKTQRTGRITVLTGQYKNAVLPIRDGEEIFLGRDGSKCHLVFDNERVSRVQCSVRYNQKTNTYCVTDHSSYGTFVKGGKQLQKEQPEMFRGNTVFVLGKSGEEFMVR